MASRPRPTTRSSVFNGVSAALLIDNDLWLASYQSDRVAVRKLDYRP